MRRWLALALLLSAGAVEAREALGIFESWGAFRDDTPYRCFAIAEPVEKPDGKWRPFASVGHWPDRNVRSQLHIRLSRERKPSADAFFREITGQSNAPRTTAQARP